MAGDPDSLTLLQLRRIREELSTLRGSVDALSARVVELELREAVDSRTRIRHEEALAELSAGMERIGTRLGLRDGA